jgi:predicted CXXCH cytochrome family protein
VKLKVSCTSCHDPSASALRASHGEFDLSDGNCLGCHDPHRSEKPGLLRAVRHEPFSAESCLSCHEPPAPGREVRLVKTQAELCAECHGDVAPSAPSRQLHPPVEEGMCSECHNAHAESREGLLKDSDPALCGSCHGDVAALPAGSDPALVHSPVRDGSCRSCHGDHDGIMPGLLRDRMPDVCDSCHQPVVERSRWPNGHAPAKAGECLKCHSPHAGAEEGLLKAPVREVCAECHDQTTAAFKTDHGGFDVTGNCTSCHNPHGSKGKGLRPSVEHRPYAENRCENCHAGPGAMKAAVPELCTSCHGDHAGDAAKPVRHAAVVEGASCLNCHSPHAGETPALLVRDQVDKTCLSCHERSMFAGPVKHPGFEDCSTCHDAHGSETKGLLSGAQEELCMTCHDVSTTHVHPYSGPTKDPRTREAMNCTSCHNPHSSQHEHLLLKEKKRALCVECHVGPDLEVIGEEPR